MVRGVTLSSKIHSVFIFLRSGENLVSVLSPVVKLDQTILTGLLTAIREFGHEAIDEEIRTIEAGVYRFHYDALQDIITVGLADSGADVLEVQAVLHSLNVLFLNKFEDILARWDGGTRMFEKFIPTIQQALAAHNTRFEAEKQELTSAEFLLSSMGEVLDILLLNILIGSAVIVCCSDEHITRLRESLDELLPFKIPHMDAITDMEITRGILQSRKHQVHKTSTLLGVTEKVFKNMVVPEYIDHYLFLRCDPDGGCWYQAPPNQFQMNIAKTSLALSESLSEQGQFLEFQLRELIKDLRYFISFRKHSPHLSLDDIQSLLHLNPKRFELLRYLHEEFGSSSGPLSVSLLD